MAAILKATGQQSVHTTPQAVAFNFDDVTAKAQAYLADVRGQAAGIVSDAQGQADQIRQQARRDGRQDAARDAEEAIQGKIEQQLQFLVPAISEAVVEVQRERTAWLRRWEQNVVTLAVAIAERVIRREVTAQPEISLDLLREALQMAAGMGKLRVHLHPQDRAALASNLAMVVAEMNQLAPTELIADEAITPGGCRVDTDYGSIDQQIESQLNRIREELTDAA